MPAKSWAQAGKLYHEFGPDWVKLHHYTPKGPLPAHVGGKSVSKKTYNKHKGKRKRG